MSDDNTGFDPADPAASEDSETDVDPDVKQAEEGAAGPAEEDDPGNDSIASTGAVE